MVTLSMNEIERTAAAADGPVGSVDGVELARWITPPRLSQNRTCGPASGSLGRYQRASVSWSVTRGGFNACQRALSEATRSRNHAGG